MIFDGSYILHFATFSAVNGIANYFLNTEMGLTNSIINGGANGVIYILGEFVTNYIVLPMLPAGLIGKVATGGVDFAQLAVTAVVQVLIKRNFPVIPVSVLRPFFQDVIFQIVVILISKGVFDMEDAIY